jgi:hypothetical protein
MGGERHEMIFHVRKRRQSNEVRTGSSGVNSQKPNDGKEGGVLNKHEKDSELNWRNRTDEWKERRTHNSRDQNEVF